MSRLVDSIIAYRVLRMLVTPFEDTEAFQLGIIDKTGKELKPMRSLNSVKERDAYTILHRMIFRIKRIIEKVPVENKKLASFAAALSLVREHHANSHEPIDLEMQYINRLQEDLTDEIALVEDFISNKRMLTFKLYAEDAPANNAVATPGVDGFTPDTLGVRKKPKILKRNEVNNAKINS